MYLYLYIDKYFTNFDIHIYMSIVAMATDGSLTLAPSPSLSLSLSFEQRVRIGRSFAHSGFLWSAVGSACLLAPLSLSIDK